MTAQSRRRKSESVGMTAASLAVLALLNTWLWRATPVWTLIGTAGSPHTSAAIAAAGCGALAMLIVRLLLRRLPEAGRGEAGSPKRLTVELAAALIAGCAVLVTTGNIVAAVAADRLLAGPITSPVPYILGGAACVVLAAAAARLVFRHLRRPPPAGTGTRPL